MHWRITSAGQGAPAIIPVRRLERSNSAKSRCASMSMNIVGTPSTLVQRSRSIVRRVDVASNVRAGSTIAAPWVTHASVPITMPKQW